MFTFMFTKLEEKIKEGQEYLGGPPEPLLLALIHAIAPTPDNIVKLFSARMLPWCIQCVSLLMQEPLNDAQAVRDALGVLKQSLEHEPGDPAHLPAWANVNFPSPIVWGVLLRLLNLPFRNLQFCSGCYLKIGRGILNTCITYGLQSDIRRSVADS